MEGRNNIINFGAGPAKIPKEVLLGVQKELLNYDGTGISIMETSHRSSSYAKVNDDAANLVRELLVVPDSYRILFMHGGGNALFSAIPANLMNRTGVADYFVTGIWSSNAAKEAKKYGQVNLVLPEAEKRFDLPDEKYWQFSPNASYVYYCANETIEGFEFPNVPETNGVPLVCDMSSNLFTKKIDVSKYGIVFAGAQKNIGTAGVTLVIIRNDLIGNAIATCPSILDFSIVAKAKSLQNTPPTFVVYVLLKVLEWIKKNGGVDAMEKHSDVKSCHLYSAIDSSGGFYYNEISKNYRSRINVTFRLRDGLKEEAKFVEMAQKKGMIQLKGHRMAGGIRASLYNAITKDEVDSLLAFMNEFQSGSK